MPENDPTNGRVPATRQREAEQAIFQSRAADIKAVLDIPEITGILVQLRDAIRVLDLFTGTGAGIQALYTKLLELGKHPSEMVGVDHFRMGTACIFADALEFYDRARYPLCRREAERNIAHIPEARIIQQEVEEYIRQFVTRREMLPFDLITGFSIPDRATPLNSVIGVLRIIEQLGNPVTLGTFGRSARTFVEEINGQLSISHMNIPWRFYNKPQGIGPSDWDCWILSNRYLIP